MLEDAVNRLFDQLEAFRSFPKYSVERRVDFMVGMYLPEFLSSRPVGDRSFSDVKLVAQEFPLRKNADDYQTANADFLFQHSGGWILCELKTDPSSYDPEQLDVYCRVANNPMEAKALIEGVRDVRRKSRAWKKYEALLAATSDRSWSGPVEVLYLAPSLPTKNEGELPPGVLGLTLQAVFDEWMPANPDLLFFRLRRLLALCSGDGES